MAQNWTEIGLRVGYCAEEGSDPERPGETLRPCLDARPALPRPGLGDSDGLTRWISAASERRY